MKKFTLILFLSLLTTVSFGQDNNTYKVAFKKLMQVSGSAFAYKTMLDQMITMFKRQQLNIPNEFWEEFSTEVNKDSFNQLAEMILPIYQKQLTESDLLGIIAFYESPVGKKFAQKTPLITQESMIAGQEWGKQIGQKVMDKLKVKGYLKD